MLHFRDTQATYRWCWLPSGEKTVARPYRRQGGAIVIGKINVILMGLIVVILFALIAREEPAPVFSHSAPRLQSQIVPAAAPEPDMASTQVLPKRPAAEVEPAMPAKVTPKTSDKRSKKAEVAPIADSGPVVSTHISQAPSVHNKTGHAKTSSGSVSAEDASRKMLVFNIWSVSELRLRSAYTTLMNNSALASTQIEARKKAYLNFVAQRSRKCGELDNKFPSNINTAEKLIFNKGDVEILECHTVENNTELDKLNTHG